MSRSDKTRFGHLTFGEERRLTAGYAHHHAPAWSRDGRLLALAVGGRHHSSWTIVDRRGRVARTLDGPAAGTASFAPDGSLAFERRFGATSEVWLTPGSDAPPVRLLGGDGRLYRDPTFSPDGQSLCCTVADEPAGRTHLVLVRLSDGQRQPLTADAARADTHPAFSPDGEHLFFEGAAGGDHGVYALALAGHALERLTPADERARRPAVIDAGLIVYERAPERGPSSLVLLDRARARAQVIVDDGASRAEPAVWVNEAGKVRLAYALQPAPDSDARAPGEPPRFDIYAARLKGVG
jgi:Tol biopolymer transport system component